MKKNIEIYVKETVKSLYSIDAERDKLNISIEKTKEGIIGDYTIVVFPFLKFSKKNVADTAKEIAVYIESHYKYIGSYNIIQGFINIKMTYEYWIDQLNKLCFDTAKNEEKTQNIMIEFSSPNTNKPIHLGHVRNNLLGDSISRILNEAGYNVTKVNLINDRGVHICKSMLAWIKWGNKATPETTGMKGDKLVGEYYVLFDKKYKEELKILKNQGFNDEEAQNKSQLMLEVRELLQKWESNDKETRKIWETMNSWVYKGFDETYKLLNIEFDKLYYESDTYLLGKQMVEKGLNDGIFTKDEDSSVWIDLTNEGLDRKIILRSDGTTVYITQDIGTAFQRFEEYNPQKLIYVVGSEQDYHFNVLKKIISKFNSEFANKIEHLSYGMVELPDGKMKSREGTVVDADDLINEMIENAKSISEESGRINEFDDETKEKTIKMIALGALKYYILKVDPKKQMLFNPKESIDFNGNTGPFIQYTHARICSVIRKSEELKIKYNGNVSTEQKLLEQEVQLILLLSEFNSTIKEAAEKYNPGIIANYLYLLAKNFNQYYHEYTILKAENATILHLRLIISQQVCYTLKKGLEILGIEAPEVM